MAAFPLNKGMKHLLNDGRTVLFLFSVFLLAMGYMGWRGTFSLYLEDMGANPGLIGTFFAISSAFEIPLVAASSRWLGRWGARASLLVSFSVFIILWIGCSLIQQPSLALPLALVHGFSYGIYDVSGVVYTGQIAPSGYANLAQGAYGGITRGLGSIIGSLTGGYFFQNIGGANAYRISALLGFLALCWFGFTLLNRTTDHGLKETIGK